VAGALALSITPVAPAGAVDQIGTERFRKSVTVGGILAHERVFQRIANRNGGTRASGTPGYDASVDYVTERLRKAGYKVREQRFTFPFFAEYSDPVLQQTSPDTVDYETATFEYSGSGDVTGTVVPVNLTIPPPAVPGTAPSGCEPGDFADPGAEPAVALVQRGTCNFGVKAANAEAAGYDAVVIFNEGQEGRTEVVSGTLGEPVGIPVVGASYADGVALAEQAEEGPVTLRVATDTETDLDATTSNVIATSRRGNPEKTVVVGAHLDSVLEGAGINDNGSGSAAILEIAEEMAEAKVKPRQRVRFAFWGAEESGLLGSAHYVDSLSDNELGRIVANLNFDMLGSTNYVRFVYDGDGSDSDPAGPPGSAQIEEVFTDYFDSQGLASDPSPFTGRSDYGPFIAAGIPAGGLFTGAEGVKTPEQAEVYGGEAGVSYDPCYHAACDDMSNISTAALDEMGDAAAHAVLTLAMSRTGFYEDGSFRTARYRAPSFEHRGSHLQR
jgi:Zn-dependent M28 family amino/carboxypeptidase